MRFYNIFRYDFRYGFLSRPGKWTAVVLYGVFLFISFSFSLFHGFYGEVEGLWDINSLSLSTGDVFMADLGGQAAAGFSTVAKLQLSYHLVSVAYPPLCTHPFLHERGPLSRRDAGVSPGAEKNMVVVFQMPLESLGGIGVLRTGISHIVAAEFCQRKGPNLGAES